ncbi:telomere recombination domain protein [Leptospira interrogans serovar Bataviae str. HAI135]|nr:telomere recombination domain protein [Leptospira interrogans serovar Bataviae str. HAI135]
MEAAKILLKGGLVVFPTETVYGIGASAFDIDACKRIYKVKNRPSDNPLIHHVENFFLLIVVGK